MSMALLIMTWVTSAVAATIIVAFAGPAAATSINYPEIQTVSSQGPGYMILAGTTVRDHRTNKGSSGNWTPSGTSGTPPPLTSRPRYKCQPAGGGLCLAVPLPAGKQPGGVLVSPGSKRR